MLDSRASMRILCSNQGSVRSTGPRTLPIAPLGCHADTLYEARHTLNDVPAPQGTLSSLLLPHNVMVCDDMCALLLLGRQGGGMHVAGGGLLIAIGVLFRSNNAESGPALYFDGGAPSSQLINCSFLGHNSSAVSLVTPLSWI